MKWTATQQARSGDRSLAARAHVVRMNVGGCSGWSSPHSVVVAHPPTSAPSLSVPSSDHDGGYTVSWGSVSRATSYTLQERKNSGGWSTIYSGSSRSKARSGRTDGSWGYRVEACNAGGCGPWSTTHTVSVTIIPPVPSNVTGHEQGGYRFISRWLDWDAVSGATHYDVKVGASGNVVNVGTVTTYQMDSYRSTTIPPPITGYVRACNANGCSAWASAIAF